MDVKPGYKQTEVGVIPDGWEAKRLDELGAWKGGMTPSMRNPSYWLNGNVPWISSGDVKPVLLKETGFSITAFAVRQGTTTLLPPNSIVVVTRSGILRKYLPVAMNVIPMAINQDIKALIPTEKFCSTYLLHALIGSGDQILSRCLKAGTTVESIELRWLKAFVIPLPPRPEQRAIAGALSDVDALLGALDRLIAKKRDLKQAAMQQLLTGQTRLPGFKGEWEVRSLRDACSKIQDGTHFSPQLGGNDFLYVTSKNIRFGTLDMSTAERISAVEHAKIYVRCDVKKGDLLLTKDGANTGNAALNPLDEPFSLLSSVALLRFDSRRHDPAYFLQQILSNYGQQQIKEMMSGNAITRLTLVKIRALRFAVPSFEEQTAIAEVLSDMDAELAALEQRHVKTQALKQGMMQELLTGRIRLI